MKITRRDLLVAVMAAVAGAAGVAATGGAAKPVIHSTVFQWNDLKERPTKAGAVRAVCDGPTLALADLEMHITTLNPGQAPHPPHRHPAEELMILREGTVESVQEGRTNVVGPGGIIFEASGEEHGLRNVGTNPATYYVIKFLPRDISPAGGK